MGVLQHPKHTPGYATGHATAIYQIKNGRGRASKNRQEIIARALYTLRHLAS